jgi:NTP pyrophosphatase (non-canonical NTP hydrolase)
MDLEELSKIRDRIAQLSQRHDQMLSRFWVEDEATFTQYGDPSGVPHVTTAATCVLSFVDAPGGKLPGFLKKKRKSFVTWLLSVPWKSETLWEYNPYTAPLALATLLKISNNEVLDETRPREAVYSLLANSQDSRNGAISMQGYPPSGLVEEVGELAKALRARVDVSMSDEDTSRKSVRLELSDCFIYLLHMANTTDIDLYSAFREKERLNANKRWSRPEQLVLQTPQPARDSLHRADDTNTQNVYGAS